MVLKGKAVKGTKSREVNRGGGGGKGRGGEGREGKGREGKGREEGGKGRGREGKREREAPVEAAAWIGQLRYPYLCCLSRAGSPG